MQRLLNGGYVPHPRQPTSRRSGGDKRVKHTVAEQRFTPLSFVAAGRVKVSFFSFTQEVKKVTTALRL